VTFRLFRVFRLFAFVIGVSRMKMAMLQVQYDYIVKEKEIAYNEEAL
jgi:hypothetical protein